MEAVRTAGARRTVGGLLLVWVACTALNVGKAAHIDDGAHLLVAEHIARDPLHPMSGLVFWDQDAAAPIHHLNQPHLFFYLLAGIGALSGGSTVAMQLGLSLFVALAIASFRALHLRLVGERGVVAASALLFVGPAFLPGQNLMTDAPLLSLWLAFLWALVDARGEKRVPRLAVAGALLGVALLVKYTSLALLPVLALDLWRERDRWRGWLVALGAPIAVLAAWSAFNVWDYGGVHLVGRHAGSAGDLGALENVGVTLGRAVLFTLTLGAIAPFTIALAPRLGPRRAAVLALVVVVLAAGTQVVATQVPQMQDEAAGTSVLRALFLVSGIAIGGLALGALRARPEREAILMFAAAASATLFVVVLSPFVAVRHAMLVLPPLLLLALRDARVRSSLEAPLGRAAIALTVALGIALAVADRRWAETYRAEASHLRDSEGTVWFVGHWGWQWYASREGAYAYEPGTSRIVSGDRVVRPWLVAQPVIAEADQRCLVLESRHEITAGPLDLVRTTTVHQGYYAVWEGLPWTVSSAPVEVFEHYRFECAGAGTVRSARRTTPR